MRTVLSLNAKHTGDRLEMLCITCVHARPHMRGYLMASTMKHEIPVITHDHAHPNNLQNLQYSKSCRQAHEAFRINQGAILSVIETSASKWLSL